VVAVTGRHYDNSGRQAQARATRAAVVSAAHDLFVDRGYVATTVEAIGQAAGVPLATVYRLLGSKRAILTAVLEVSFVGDDEPVALHERQAVRAAFAQEDPRVLVAAFAGVCREVFDRSAPIQRVLRGAAGADPAAAEILDWLNRQRLDGQTRVARALAERGALAEGVTADAAADTIYALMAPEVHHVLVGERGWDPDRYERWLAESLSALILR
jgi:AcrR family transcriptional regulator